MTRVPEAMMELTFSAELEQFIRQQVASGRYAREEDVVTAALIRLKQENECGFSPGELEAMAAQREETIRRGDTVTLEELPEHFRNRRN